MAAVQDNYPKAQHTFLSAMYDNFFIKHKLIAALFCIRAQLTHYMLNFMLT